MIKKILVIIIVLMIGQISSAQSLITDSIRYSYFDESSILLQQVKIYEIRNETPNVYLLWIVKNPIQNKNTKNLIHDYFLRRRHDFNLLNVLNEDFVDYSRIEIGQNFLKEINPNESFYIATIGPCEVNLSNKIVLVKKDIVENYLKIKIKQQFLFDKSILVLMNKCPQ